MKILFDSFVLVMISVFLVMLGEVSFYKVGHIHFRPYQIPLLIAFSIVIFKFLMNRVKIQLRLSYFLSILLIILTIAISLFKAEYPLLTLKQLLLLSLYISIFLLIVNTCDSERKIILLHRIIIYGCFIATVYGFVMMIITNLPGVEREGGFIYNRPKSFFTEPNEFGQYLVFVFGYMFAEVVFRKKNTNRLIFWITFILILLLIVPNMSRGAWLACIVIIGFVFYFHNKFSVKKINIGKKVKVIFLMICFSILALLIASKYIVTNGTSVVDVISARVTSLFSGSDATSMIRFNNNLKAFNSMLENPFTGVGFGNAFIVIEERIKDKEKENILGGKRNQNDLIIDNKKKDNILLPKVVGATSSNFLADIGMEIGIFGLLSFIFFMVLVIIKAVIYIKRINNPYVVVVYVGALASFIGLIVNGITYSIHLLPFFWISAGILSVRFKNE
ncbi:MAG: hypothetical protein A2551_07975 [Elusimicrobia bacterium RIFOXYD2_FULL_34_30]|nr:MAG: hypothetical protein A2551_07975 [Elusimicrobia bacterium RIFOXYD2_FULL_34_30]